MVQQASSEQVKYEALLSSLADGIIILDEKMLVTKINSAFTEIFGYTSSELIGKRVRDVIKIKKIDRSFLPDFKRSVERLAKARSPVIDTLVWTKKDDTEVVIETLSSSYWLDGKVAGTVVIVRDVSVQASIDRAKTEFVSLAAHQLRTPLSSINWYLEMLAGDEQGQLSKKQTDYLAEVRTANQRMVTLVNDLLNVSRIDLGTFAIKPDQLT